MAQKVQVEIEVVDKSGKTSTIMGNITKGLKNIENQSKSTSKGTDSVFKGLMKFELAKKALQSVVGAFKEFEKAGGKTPLQDLEKGLKQIQVEFASALMPALNTFSKWMKDNEPVIQNVARTIGTVLGGAFRILGSTAQTVYGLIEPLVYILGTGLAEAVTSITFLLRKIPARFLPEGWKESLDDFDAKMNAFGDKMADKAVKAANNYGDTFKKNIKSNLATVNNVLSEGMAKPSGLRARTDAEIKAEADKARQIEAIDKRLLEYKKQILENEIDIIKDKKRKTEEELKTGYWNSINMEKEELSMSAAQREVYQRYVLSQTKKFVQDLKELDEAKYRESQDKEKDYITYINGSAIERSNFALAQKKFILSNEKDTLSNRLKLTQLNAREELNTRRDYRISALTMDKEYQAQRLALGRISQEQYYTNVMSIEGKIFAAYEEFRTKDIEKDKEYQRAKFDTVLQYVSEQVNVYASMAQQIVSIGQSMVQFQLNNIEADKQKTLEAIDEKYSAMVVAYGESRKLERLRQKEQDKAEKEAEAKRKKVMQQQKGWSIASAIINGAVAITKGYADYGPIVGTIMAVLTAAVTAAQIAVIASQQFAQGGIVSGNSKTGDKVNARVNSGEMILNEQQQARLFQMANGNAPRANLSVGGDTIVINGNADEAMVRRVVAESKEQQLRRFKETYEELVYRGQLRAAA